MKRAIQKLAGSGLSHPFTWLMVALLLANDLVLKPYFPSWVSGKLSDLALVYLLSLTLFVLLEVLWPMSRSRFIMALGSLPVVFLFGVAKTIPAVNQLVVNLLQSLLPFESHFLLDPSDALALLMILPAIVVWKRSHHMPQTTAWRLIILPVMMLAVIGDAAAPQTGIGCLQYLDNGSILAYSPYQYTAYKSDDGGLSWNAASQEKIVFDNCEIPNYHPGDVFEFTAQDGLLLRFEINKQILESTDGGQNWKAVFSLKPPSQAQIANLKQKMSNYQFLNGPLSVLEDPEHDTVIATMGVEGALVRPSDGVWQAVAVGGFVPFSAMQPIGIEVVWVELLMSILGGIFLFSLFSLRWTKRWWRIAKVIAAWIGWILIMSMSPAISDNYILPMIIGLGLPLAILWAIFCLVDDLFAWRKRKDIPRKRMVLIAVIAALTGMLPFVFWAANIIKSYSVAQLIVFGLMLIFAIVGTIWSGSAPSTKERNDKP